MRALVCLVVLMLSAAGTPLPMADSGCTECRDDGGALVETALRAQLPLTLPEPESEGWPQHAFTLAITWQRLGEDALARHMGDELWKLRDDETGLWENAAGYVDTANPFFATLLYTLTGQDGRAEQTAARVVWRALEKWDGGAYNKPLFAALTQRLVGVEPAPELLRAAEPGLDGTYSTHDRGETARGRYYADIMRAYRCMVGGECAELVSDEADYCAELSEGRQECEAFYHWARGEQYVPVLGEGDYDFWTDGVLFYALPGLGLGMNGEPAAASTCEDPAPVLSYP